VNWTNTTIYAGSAPQIYNYGLWNEQSDDTFDGANLGGASTVFDNIGTFLKSGHTGTTTLDSRVVFNNSGAVNIQSGGLALNGAVSLTAGALDFGIASTNSFAKLILSGAAGLAGSLGVTSYGYTPQIGDSFGLVSYGSETGVFTSFDLPGAYNWGENYGPSLFTLSVTGIAGPANVSLLLGQPPLTSAGFNLQVSGPPGSNYTIQFSTNLAATSWTALTNFVSASSVSSVTDTAATNSSPGRFYRALMR
jgi:hypothetical protein